MVKELQFRIEQEADVLMHDFREDGLLELQHDIRERRATGRPNRLYYFLEAPGGTVIFDDLKRIPRPFGWHEVSLQSDAAPVTQTEEILLLSLPLIDGHVLAIAGSMDNIERVQSIVLRSLLSAIALTIVLGSLSGYILARRFLARIDSLNRAADRIGHGHLSERLKRDGSGDDFDQLVGTINKMLQRIELLVESLKRVS